MGGGSGHVLATVWKVAFQKETQFRKKAMKVSAGFVGYSGTESSLPTRVSS